MKTPSATQRRARVGAAILGCTVLVAATIVPVLASNRSVVSSGSDGLAHAQRLLHLQVERAGADADELTELDAMIDAEDGGTDSPDAIDSPEATDLVEPTEAPEATDPAEAADAPEATERPKATHTPHPAETADDQADDNDDQGDNNDDQGENDQESGSGSHDSGDSGDSGDAGGD